MMKSMDGRLGEACDGLCIDIDTIAALAQRQIAIAAAYFSYRCSVFQSSLQHNLVLTIQVLWLNGNMIGGVMPADLLSSLPSLKVFRSTTHLSLQHSISRQPPKTKISRDAVLRGTV